MPSRCANHSCSSFYASAEGKLFRVDLEIASTASSTQHKTVFLWLCGNCAPWMNPTVEVTGDTVRVMLAATPPPSLGEPASRMLLN